MDNTLDVERIEMLSDEMLRVDCAYHNPGTGRLLPDRESVKEFVPGLRERMSDSSTMDLST